jgi:hypothetical protein
MIDRVLSDYIDAWNAGRRPDVDAYLARVPEPEREGLAERLAEWLTVAPAPAYPAAARGEIRADPRLRAALQQTARPPGALLALRRSAGLGLNELAARVVQAFGLGGQEGRTADYLTRLEHGELDEARVSRRLLGVLASALGQEPRLAASTPAMLFRGAGEPLAGQFEALSRAALEPAPPPMDDLDRLFLGGPDA